MDADEEQIRVDNEDEGCQQEDDQQEEQSNLKKAMPRRPKSCSRRTFLTQEHKQRRANSQKNRPAWERLNTRGSTPVSDTIVTHVNQTHDQVRARDMAAIFNEGQTSADWLTNHSIGHYKLTLKALLNRGNVIRKKNSKNGPTRELQFEASIVNEFEYKIYECIEMYHNRIKWLLEGSRKTFGLIKGMRVAVVIDSSDSNCGFGRISHFRQALTELIDEQLHNKEKLYFMSFGTDIDILWDTPRFVNIRVVDEARGWVNRLSGCKGCNLLFALKKILQMKEIDSIVLVLGTCPDQSSDVLVEYVEQVCAGRTVPFHAVAFDCNNHLTNMTLRKIADATGGRYHVYTSNSEDQIYNGTDIAMLLQEIKTAQDVINKIAEMRQGMMGDALVSILNEISLEVQKLPQSRFLPRPPNHTACLNIEDPSFQPKTSQDWLKQNGLKAKRLSLYQVLAPNAFAPIEEFIPIIRKSVRSQTHEKAMTQFEWHDGTIRNVHVDQALLYDYQKQLGAMVKLYEQRIDWLSKDSRRLFGTICETRVAILIDLSVFNVNYLVHIQHSLRLLLEQQTVNKQAFNIIGFGSKAKAWRPCLQNSTPENIESAWRWVLGLECSGSRNFLSALRMALENEDDRKRCTSVDGLYLFTSGVPDQSLDVICSYVEETTAGQPTKIHAILFNVDDYNANGAIPGRYANITQTAECLRTMSHVTNGRFHWFRETGIIESDDIKAILSEMDKAVNYSQKSAMLVDSVKRRAPKENMERFEKPELKMLPMRPSSGKKKSSPAPVPKHTELSFARLQITENKEREESVLQRSNSWCPSSPKRSSSAKRPTSATKESFLAPPDSILKESLEKEKKPKRPSSAKNKPIKQVFYTDHRNEVGTVYKQYPDILHKTKKNCTRKIIHHPVIPDREELLTTKEWLKKYSLVKLKLDLTKLVSGPDCAHAKSHINTLPKSVAAKYCTILPSINVKGKVKHLQLQTRELQDYENQLESVLNRYLRRLQWLLGASRRTFGSVVEKQVIVLVDTSGSMVMHMDELKREMVALIWDQFKRENISFNLMRFSGDIELWRPQLVEPTEENCLEAVRWVSTFVPAGNTCTLEALMRAFQDKNVSAIYMLTDGKPDSSCAKVLREVANVNTIRGVKIHTISFNCEDETANIFLRQLAAMCRGRYHRCYAGMDGDFTIHKLLDDGFKDNYHPILPQFESDDLRHLVNEVEQARHFLCQSRSFHKLFAGTSKTRNTNKPSELSASPNQSTPSKANDIQESSITIGAC